MLGIRQRPCRTHSLSVNVPRQIHIQEMARVMSYFTPYYMLTTIYAKESYPTELPSVFVLLINCPRVAKYVAAIL
jgi:hypothetical protein